MKRRLKRYSLVMIFVMLLSIFGPSLLGVYSVRGEDVEVQAETTVESASPTDQAEDEGTEVTMTEAEPPVVPEEEPTVPEVIAEEPVTPEEPEEPVPEEPPIEAPIDIPEDPSPVDEPIETPHRVLKSRFLKSRLNPR